MFTATRISLQLYTKVNHVRPPLHAWLSFMLEHIIIMDNVSLLLLSCMLGIMDNVSLLLLSCMLGIMDNVSLLYTWYHG